MGTPYNYKTDITKLICLSFLVSLLIVVGCSVFLINRYKGASIDAYLNMEMRTVTEAASRLRYALQTYLRQVELLSRSPLLQQSIEYKKYGLLDDSHDVLRKVFLQYKEIQEFDKNITELNLQKEQCDSEIKLIGKDIVFCANSLANYRVTLFVSVNALLQEVTGSPIPERIKILQQVGNISKRTSHDKIIAPLNGKFYLEYLRDTQALRTIGKGPAFEVVGIFSILLSLLAIALIIFWKNFLRTVSRLLNAIHGIGKGEFKEIPLDSHHSFGGVIVHFNDIISSLKEVATLKYEAALGKIATQVAHDICSPLSSMQAAVKYFQTQEGADPSKRENYLNLLQLSANRIQGIADDLLKKNVGERGIKVIFSLHQILDELVGEYSAQEQYAAVIFVKNYNAGAIELCGDRMKLQRAIGNIVKNAMESMEYKGHVTITTELESTSVKISISDTGSGMSEEKLSKVIQGQFTEGKQNGHGIGITVAKEVAASFAGIFDGVSELGKGSTFTFLLPLPNSADIVGVAREKTAVKEFTLDVGEEHSILVVEDEPSMREQWRLLLNEWNIQAILCESYEDVEAKLHTMKTTTAIVDYHFSNSEKNGADVVRFLKDHGFTHITMCTAEAWRPQVQSFEQELGVQICPKPLPTVIVCRHPRIGKQEIATSTPSESPRNDNIKPLILVIDDDKMIHDVWRLDGERRGVGEVHAYTSMEACEEAKPEYAAYDYAFVDLKIPNTAWRIDQVIKHLKSSGVKKVIVASGLGKWHVRHDPHCAAADGLITQKIPEKIHEYLAMKE